MLRGKGFVLLIFTAFLAAYIHGAAGQGRQGFSLTCDEAQQLHRYAVETLESCKDPANQNAAICALLQESQSDSFSGNYTSPDNQLVTLYDQLGFLWDPVASLSNTNWQNYLIQSTVASGADFGQVAYIVNNLTNAYNAVNVTSVTNEEYYETWQSVWWAQADYTVQQASNPKLDALSKVASYFKAANFYFTGSWPSAFSADAITASEKAVTALKSGLEAHPTWKSMYFNVPFDNGTATAQLPGIFITPDPSKRLPVVMWTSGIDYTKEETFLQFSRDTLARGYAVLVYDGPGQGMVLKKAPNMPLYPNWEKVIGVILNYVKSDLSQYVQLDKIAQNGVSLGGYLGTRGCAVYSDRLTACIANPPRYSLTDIYDGFVQSLGAKTYAPFLYVQENNASLLSIQYQESWDNYNEIAYSLLLTCNASSAAPQLINDAFKATSGVIDPQLTYLAAGYGGVVSGDANVLYSGLWQGYNKNQAFGRINVTSITTPVIGFKGTEDNLLGGQEDLFFAMLSPGTEQKSVLYTFDHESGAALSSQAGSPDALTANLFASLTPIFQGQAIAPVPSPAALPSLRTFFG